MTSDVRWLGLGFARGHDSIILARLPASAPLYHHLDFLNLQRSSRMWNERRAKPAFCGDRALAFLPFDGLA